MNIHKLSALILSVLMFCLVFAGCAKAPVKDDAAKAPDTADPTLFTDTQEPAGNLADGKYMALFKTDSSMFHVNEVYNGRGILTVENGKMTIHVPLPSQNTVNLFYGVTEEAQKDGAKLIQPVEETVTFEDGTTKDIYAFDIPVPALDEEFDCALIGTKGKWYDHKVSVSDPVPFIEDGEYTMVVTMTGGTGKASVNSPAKVTVKYGTCYAEVVWSSSHYEYMTIGDTQYDPVNTEGNSTFVIPVILDRDIEVSALTTAMSEPHLIDYVLHFDSSTLKAAES